jgi:hypothetical protein
MNEAYTSIATVELEFRLVDSTRIEAQKKNSTFNISMQRPKRNCTCKDCRRE